MLQPVDVFLGEADVAEPCLIEPGVLPTDGKLVLYGRPGIGKSLLVQQLGFEVACGLPWLGQMPVQQGRVAYVQCEVSRGQFRERLRKQMGGYELPEGMFYVLTSLVIQAERGNKDYGQLLDDLERVRPNLLILDPQYKLLVGDENDGTALRDFYNSLDTIIAHLGCAIVLVSHTRKTHTDNEGQPTDMGYQELKGSSRQVDWADTVIRLAPGRAGLTLRFEKLRNGDPLEAMKLAFDKETLLFSGQADLRADDTIMALLSDGPLLRTDLMAALLESYSESTVKRALSRLEEGRRIDLASVPNNRAQKLVRRL